MIKASKGGYVEIVDALIQAGGSSLSKAAAFDVAAYSGHTPILRRLVLAGVDIQAHDNKALLSAALNGDIDVVRWLLQAGADVHARRDGALRLTAESGHLAFVECLLQAGASVDSDGFLALRLAALKGHIPVSLRLLAEILDPPISVDAILAWARLYSDPKLSLALEKLLVNVQSLSLPEATALTL